MEEPTKPETKSQSSDARRDWRRYRREHRGSPIWALLFIVLGIVFLLNNFGVLGWDVWNQIWRFWPVLLVLVGLQIVLGRSFISRFIILVIVIVIIGWIAIWSITGGAWNGTMRSWSSSWSFDRSFGNIDSSQNVTIKSSQYPTLTNRVVTVSTGIANLNLDDKAADGTLLALDAASSSAFAAPSVSQSESNGRLALSVAIPSAHGMMFGFDDNADYMMSLGSPSIPTDLTVNTGVGKTTVTLSSLTLQSFDLETATGLTDVTLSDTSIPSSPSTLSVGTGSASLHLPSDVGIKVHYAVGLSRIKIGSNSFQGTGDYSTPEYGSAPHNINLDVSAGTGAVTITQ